MKLYHKRRLGQYYRAIWQFSHKLGYQSISSFYVAELARIYFTYLQNTVIYFYFRLELNKEVTMWFDPEANEVSFELDNKEYHETLS